ncbi:L,D-transpeptidase [Caulobacter soli]|uniref:L,D-transpeptidase n=1 Tax=Caulobacter soli TaxID=2708539 RepID=UPI00196B868D|nr:L,D-transpeptidase [Caulobacter soli]
MSVLPLLAVLLGLGSAASGMAAVPAPTSPWTVGSDPSEATMRKIRWAIASNDNGDLPFVVVDKRAARVFVLDRHGLVLGAAPALLGLAKGDVSPPGIGDRPLSAIGPADRITPAGRFVAGLGPDLGAKDVLWVDYAAAISLHRVVTSNPREHRLERLATASILDNRISYGCINVPAKFFDDVVRPAFLARGGVVYILPELAAED